MASNGNFVWHELMTTDVDAAIAFYTEVIGWKTQPFEGGDKPYTMFCIGDQPIGGVMALPDEAKAMGAPPHWLGHAKVADLAASTASAKKLGGTILHQMTIPEVGSFAVTKDPQGAVMSMFQPEGDMEAADRSKPGAYSWAELNTTDYESAWKFYSGVLGWKPTESMDMGDGMGQYFMFTHPGGEGSMGGMSNVAEQMNMPPFWLYYANVDDIDSALARIQSKGGKVMNGPMDVPGGGKIAQCADPQGCAFAIYYETR